MSLAANLPLLTRAGSNDVLVWERNGPLRATEVFERAATLSRALPPCQYVVNLCDRRGAFLVGFVAALQRGATTLLPSSRSAASLAELARQYPDRVTLDDSGFDAEIEAPTGVARPASTLEADPVAAIVFTSGSTGTPQGHAKRWSSMLAIAEHTREQLLETVGPCNLVATVPAQHMYGLETGILLCLAGGCAVNDERPFFPRDIAEELERLPPPRVLVTTPAHLRACVSARAELPSLALVISATAPLPDELAADAEALWHAPVHEIYGCTEAGSLATRRTLDGDLWHPFRGTRIEVANEQALFHAEYLPGPVLLQDMIEVIADGSFRLVGRSGDLVKIAGKRASLADLTWQLLAIRGVTDAVIFMPEDDGRCAALVVAPALTREQVLLALAARIDPAFLPRPLLLVTRLPRNEAGKLPHEALLTALGASGD